MDGCAVLRVSAMVLFLSTPVWATDLLNVSFDPTREFYQEYNQVFAEHWTQQTGETVTVRQSHGGSISQARRVMAGMEADVVTLALGYDIDAIAEKTGWIPLDWQEQFPADSAPFTSTIVFLVREGNPKGIGDWPDVVRPGVSVVTPNPKTSGGGRWNYLAARAYAARAFQDDATKTIEFMVSLYRNAEFLDSTARESTLAFVEEDKGDVLVTWENEARWFASQQKESRFEVVMPSLSILAEPPVAVVEGVAEKHGTSTVARAYLQYLYSETGQKLAAKYFFRPLAESDQPEFRERLPKVERVTIEKEFGGWEVAQSRYFDRDQEFDIIFECRHKPFCPEGIANCRR